MPDTSAIDAAPPAGQRPQVPAADQTLRILAYLTRQRGPVPARTIASALDIPRSTIYHLLATLEEHQFVVHLPEERRWGLGIAAFELAGGYARQEPLARVGRPVLADLVDRVRESAHLAVMHGRDVLYIVEERAPHRPALVTDVGVRLPAHLTATGRAMLAALPREQVRALYPDASAFSDRTGRGPARPGELRELLREVRARGFAVEEGEVTLGLRSIGVAVRDHAGWPAAAIALTWPDDPVPNSPMPDGPVRNAPVRDGPVPDGPVRDDPVRNAPVPEGVVRKALRDPLELARAASAAAAELERRIGRGRRTSHLGT